MVTIKNLRKNKVLLDNLGFREKDILFSKGARVSVASDFPPKGAFLKVKAGNKSFVFARRDNRNARKYMVVN